MIIILSAGVANRLNAVVNGKGKWEIGARTIHLLKEVKPIHCPRT